MKHLLLLALVAGCLENAATVCSDGIVCPVEKICIPGGCALPEQVAPCVDQPEGASCAFAGAAGQCAGGICVGLLCGNGELDATELCDDGNTSSGDGCRADCSKLEVCGDAFADVGEGCDDGNTNPADGCDACRPNAWSATAVVGGNANARTVGMSNPHGIARDLRGNLYIADTDAHQILRVAPNGVTVTVAGTGTFGFSGDGGFASNAQLNAPEAIAVDGLGNLYIADSGNFRVRRVDRNGIITTLAGLGFSSGSTGDGGPAIAAGLGSVDGIAVDGLGNIYLSDTAFGRIRKIDAVSGIITIYAGTTSGRSGDGGPATLAQLNRPTALAFDASGRLLVADTWNNRIRRIDASGTITTVAGVSACGNSGFCSGGFSGDGGDATLALLSSPDGVAAVADGSIYIADGSNNRIRKVAPNGTISTFAGSATSGFGGDGSTAVAASLDAPFGILADSLGVVVVADSANRRIRQIDTAGTITTIIGSGARGYIGDGGAGTSAVVKEPEGIAIDAAGTIYIADQDNSRIRKLSPDGVITTICGTGDEGYRASDDGGLAVNALLDHPRDVAFDAAGNLYIADTGNHRIRKIDPAGVITTIAGSGAVGYDGDNAPATTKSLNAPTNIVFDATGALVFTDTQNDRIRRIDAAGTITTIVGSGVEGFGGDNGAATSAQLFWPWDLTYSGGQLYFSDSVNCRIRKVDATGKITTIAGTGVCDYSGDNGNATNARISIPRGLIFDGAGNLLIADTSNARIRRIDTAGKMSTVYGTGIDDDDGDGGLASVASIGSPSALVRDASGNIYVSTRYGSRVRRIAAGTGIITTVAGPVDPAGMGPSGVARFVDPLALTISGSQTFVAGGVSGTVQRLTSTAIEATGGRYAQASVMGTLARYRGALFESVGGIAFDPAAGVVYLTESGANRIHAITIVDPANPRTWTIAVLANSTGAAGFTNGAALSARFRNPTGLYLDAGAHELYVADTGNHMIRSINLTSGMVTTAAGTGAARGFFGDGGPATSALFYAPRALTRCGNGDLFVADTGNNRVRRISGGIISTVLGDGIAASSGEGVPASAFPVNAPVGLACDDLGNLAVTSSTSIRFLPADDAGMVDGSGPVQTIYGASPRTTFPEIATNCLSGIAVVDPTTLRVLDSCTGFFVELKRAPL
jgi:cysteine-rich repeat protein